MKKIKELYLKYESIILYVFFGGLTTVVSFASHFIARFAGADMSLTYGENGQLSFAGIQAALDSSTVSPELASTISWVCAVTFAFITNKIWVFKSNEKGAGIIREALMFYGARLVSYGVEIAAMFIFVSTLGFDELLTKLGVQILILIMNYLFSKLVVFRRKKADTIDKRDNIG